MQLWILVKPKRDAELDDMANAVFHANKTLGMDSPLSRYEYLLYPNVVKGCVSETFNGVSFDFKIQIICISA